VDAPLKCIRERACTYRCCQTPDAKLITDLFIDGAVPCIVMGFVFLLVSICQNVWSGAIAVLYCAVLCCTLLYSTDTQHGSPDKCKHASQPDAGNVSRLFQLLAASCPTARDAAPKEKMLPLSQGLPCVLCLRGIPAIEEIRMLLGRPACRERIRGVGHYAVRELILHPLRAVTPYAHTVHTSPFIVPRYIHTRTCLRCLVRTAVRLS
jgi:hypothetical protein